MPARPDDASPRARLTRRGLLAAGGAVVLVPALAGCQDGADTSAAPPGAVVPEGTPSLSPDVALATLALAEVRAAAEAVGATTRRFPALATTLAPVAAMHRTHEEALVDAVPEGAEPGADAAPYAVPRRRPGALTGLRAREQELQARLGDLALEARSGAFAALLAAMSAGTAQRVATWPT